ncbi:MAG: hypothetical protein KDE08_03040 [Rhodobacteraceae bacterium]|nr:hypothetical protein [Paracoccaceae bacterium]
MLRPVGAALSLTVLLAACGTPQENCIRTATKELRTMDALVAETEANIARGYSYEEEQVIRHTWVRCDRDFLSPGVPAPRRMCLEPVARVVKRPVAIDPQAEEGKLAGLKSRQKALESEARAAIAACRSRYPE